MMPARRLNAGSRTNSVLQCVPVCVHVCICVCVHTGVDTLANHSHEIEPYEPTKTTLDEADQVDDCSFFFCRVNNSLVSVAVRLRPCARAFKRRYMLQISLWGCY